MSSACDFYNRRSWIVYVKYTSTGEGRAAGDIFVMTRVAALAMTITGAQLTRLLISNLERILDDPIVGDEMEALQDLAAAVRLVAASRPVWETEYGYHKTATE